MYSEPTLALRWLAWKKNGSESVIVGNDGVLLLSDGSNFRRVRSSSSENLRCAAYNPVDDRLIVVGNNGTLILFENDGEWVAHRVRLDSKANLRRVSWSSDGSTAIILGNGGTAFAWDGSGIVEVEGAKNNLRSVTWSREGDAIISGNYFADAMAPSSTLYRYKPGSQELEPLSVTEKTDLICLDWKPRGDYALAVGYDLVWQEARVYKWDGSSLVPSSMKETGVYPTAVAWHPEGSFAFIGTGSPNGPGRGGGTILKGDDNVQRTVFSSLDQRVTCLSWKPDGRYCLAVMNRFARTFST